MGAALRPIGSTVLGYPSSGRQQELHQSVTQCEMSAGGVDRVRDVSRAIRIDGYHAMLAAGLDSMPVNTFSLLDPMLDTAIMLGALPPRFAAGDNSHMDAVQYLAAIRGRSGIKPLQRRPWDGSKHVYSAPEIDRDTRFMLNPTKLLFELDEARNHGPLAACRPAVIGPVTFLAQAQSASLSSFDPLTRMDDVLNEYRKLLTLLGEANVPWVQFDEPSASQVDLAPIITAVYAELSSVTLRPAILLATPSAPSATLNQLGDTAIEGLVIDVATGNQPGPHLPDINLVLGAVDGHSIRRTDLRAAFATLMAWRGRARSISVSSNCSLQHLPYDVSVETQLEPILRNNVAFADQKLSEVVALQLALDSEGDAADEAFAASDAALRKRSLVSRWELADLERRLQGAGYF